MTEFSKDLIDEMKDLAKKKGEEITDGEAQEMLNNLSGFYGILWDISKREAQQERRLKDEPKGFVIDGSYTCRVCGSSMNESNGWYDKYGMKCLLCQKALDDGMIPSFVFLNDDSYFKMWQMNSYFELKYQTVKKMIREGKLVAREIMNNEDKVHEYVFLKKENPHCIRKYNAVRKSYDRNREKVHRGWVKKKKLELIKEYENKVTKASKRSR